MGYYEGTQYKSTNDILITANTYDDDSGTTNPDIVITVQIEDGQTAGTKDLFASTNYSLHNLIFYFDDPNTSIVDDYSFYSVVSINPDGWSTIINTSELPDGEYNFDYRMAYSHRCLQRKIYILRRVDRKCLSWLTNRLNWGKLRYENNGYQ